MNIRLLWFATRRLLQAARMHKFLHLGVKFLDKAVFLVNIVVALLARRLVAFFLVICIRFCFGSFGIRLGMAKYGNIWPFPLKISVF